MSATDPKHEGKRAQEDSKDASEHLSKPHIVDARRAAGGVPYGLWSQRLRFVKITADMTLGTVLTAPTLYIR
eukprot:CAMPEP_0114556496 /NCGR_PEP_ID=MMETSP0114-20121206/9322_1 /TAXON_ID=31324 /ORGANISM="Goniomonas sp, Strain m" /LENGTH=71 /DNA_ID=CAMNT_0001741709 /DNA_START=111 /DNA_END=323 /DNA_ORIENTATION=-